MDKSFYDDWRRDIVAPRFLDPYKYPTLEHYNLAEKELVDILGKLGKMNLEQLEMIKFHVDFRIRNF